MRQDAQSLNSTQDTLRTLSSETDGRAIVNRNDLEGGLKQVIRDSSAYYLVGYNSTQTPSDGKFHEIKVRVKRPGVQVRARKGYWALTAEEATRVAAPPKPGPERGVTEALANVGSVNRARSVRTWVGMTPADARAHAGDVRVGAGAGRSRRPARGAVARVAAGRGRRRAVVLPWQGAGRRRRTCPCRGSASRPPPARCSCDSRSREWPARSSTPT